MTSPSGASAIGDTFGAAGAYDGAVPRRSAPADPAPDDLSRALAELGGAVLWPEGVGRFRIQVQPRCKLRRRHSQGNLAIVLVRAADAAGAVEGPDVDRVRTLQFDGLEIDLVARTVLLDGAPLELTRKEFDVLAYLAERRGQAVSREDILREVWQSQYDWQDPATVTEHVRRVRRKIEDDAERPRRIVTVRGIGYRFEL